MKKNISCGLLWFSWLFTLNNAQSQTDRFVYAVTAQQKGGTEWVALRKLDTRSGHFSGMLLNMANRLLPQYDLTARVIVNNTAGNNSTAVSSGVAAIAYHRKTNRIFYVAMNDDQLRYVDLGTMSTYAVSGKSFSSAGHFVFQAASPITRLVIAPDDYGYTITNDGNHLLRFTTSGTPAVTDLGELVDDPRNNENTIHSACANSGGDMVAGNTGELYLVTAANRVYQVDVTTRTTTYLATISGLPSQFTTNGAAADENGQLIVSSSVYTDRYFIVDPLTWKAMPTPAHQQLFGVADLASSNVLHTKATRAGVLFPGWSFNRSGKIKVFPNPVLFDEVSIRFSELPPGDYTIQLANVLGRVVLQQKVVVTANTQTEVMRIPAYTAQGFYYIRVLNEKSRVVSTHKLAVERW